MARLPRLAPLGVPQHIIQRGTNRQSCFGNAKDYAAYSHWLEQASKKFGVDIHAWVFMTNHVHLLATPNETNAISSMMQSLGRRYVQYYNHINQRTGTLWEGRFKSCLVDSEHYLLRCYRYIELNPVRANMVEHPRQYQWSSYNANACGKSIRLCTPHPSYLSLGASSEVRQINYRELFTRCSDKTFIRDIRSATNRGLVIGSDKFKDEIEALLAQSVRSNPVGRPRSF